MPHVEGFLLSQSPEGLRLLLGHSAVVVSDSNVESVEILDAVRLPNELKAVRVHYRDELPAPNRDALTGRGRPSGRSPTVRHGLPAATRPGLRQSSIQGDGDTIPRGTRPFGSPGRRNPRLAMILIIGDENDPHSRFIKNRVEAAGGVACVLDFATLADSTRVSFNVGPDRREKLS